MTTRKIHSPLSLYLFAGSILVSFAVLTVLQLGIAHAQTSADPVATATSAADAGYTFILQYGPIWGLMAIVYGVASKLLADAESKHWIAQGRTLAALTAASGIAGSVLETHFGGGQWSGVLVTAVLALFKLINPVTQPQKSASKPATAAARYSQSGFIRRRLMASLAMFAVAFGAAAGCALWSSAKKDVQIGIDCAKAELSAVQSGVGLLAAGIQLAASFALSVESDTEEQFALNTIAQYGEPIAACFMKEEAAGAVAAGSGSGSSAPTTGAASPRALAAARIIANHHWTFASGK